MFSSASDFILALSGGSRFDLVLLALQDEASLGGLRAACLILGMPVLAVVTRGQWGVPASKGEGIGFDGTLGANVSRMADEELAWLLRVLIQRANAAHLAAVPEGEQVWGDYHFYEDSHRVQFNGNEIRLQPRQFAFALQLFLNAGRVVERDSLWNLLWRAQALHEGKRALDVCASGVRKRLELNGEYGFVLRAVYRRGYQLVKVSPTKPG